MSDTTTTNLGLTKPEIGKGVWAAKLNTNFDILDSAVGAGGGGSSIVYVSTADKTVANTTTETSLIGTGVGSLTITANTLTAGKTYRISISGFYSYSVGVAPIFRVKIGLVTLGSAAAFNGYGSANNGWNVDFIYTHRTTGGFGTGVGQGLLLAEYLPGSVFPYGFLVNTSTLTVDTTINNTINATVQWGTADPTNTITCTNIIVEKLN